MSAGDQMDFMMLDLLGPHLSLEEYPVTFDDIYEHRQHHAK